MNILLSMPGGSEWMLVLIFLSIFIIPKIFYIATLQSTLNSISVENRKMAPGNVWLLLIPVFSAIWHFIVVGNLADSIKAEATSKKLFLNETRPAYSVGLAMCVLDCFAIIPGLNLLTILISLICWIIFWVKINGYKNLLTSARFNSIV
jgi:hypothetical protein